MVMVLRNVFIILTICLLSGCYNDDYILNDLEIEYLTNFRQNADIKIIDEYNEIYRIYEFRAGSLRPNVFAIYNLNNKWYFSHYWTEIIGEAKLFEENNITFIYHEDKYLFDKIILNKYLKNIQSMDKLKNYRNKEYFDLNEYYFEYKNKKSSGIGVFEGFNHKTTEHKKIVNIFYDILEIIKEKNE
jgi:hypothetical protein